MRNFLLLLFPLSLFLGCAVDHDRGEPFAEADYYVENNSDRPIRLDAISLSDEPIVLRTTVIAPGTIEHIYTFQEGSGGHLYPSNAFEALEIFIDSTTTPILTIDNDDLWVEAFAPRTMTLIIENGDLDIR